MCTLDALWIASVTLSALILRSSDPNGLPIWSVVGFCAGIGLFVYGFRLLQRRRLILDTPFSKIRSASMGMVEISGLAVGPYTMIAPITARPCYYYRTLVWEYKQHGKNKEWVKVAGECMHVPFFVDDNTGRMLIDPRGADLDLHRDFQQEFCDSFFTTKDPEPDNVRGFLARHGVVTRNKIKVEEFCIKPKNSLFLLGTVTENPGLEVRPEPVPDSEPVSTFSPQGFSLSMPLRRNELNTGSPQSQFAVQRDARSHEVIRLSPELGPTQTVEMTQQQRVAAALVKAGISSPAAWEAAGVPAAAGVRVISDPSAEAATPGGVDPNSGAQTNGFDPRPPVVLMKGTNNKTFLISWRSQQEVARSLGWKCTLMIWGGPALALLSLYCLFSIEHML